MNQEYGEGFEFLMEGFPDLAQERRDGEPQPAIGNRVETDDDPYEVANQITVERVNEMKAAGDLSRETMLTEDASDDHFDELRNVRSQVHAEMGLPWPAPIDQS